MLDLRLDVEGARPVPFAASPQIALDLVIRSGEPAESVRAIALRCQAWIEVQRRRYTEAEQAALSDLFGAPGLWERSLRPLLWANTSVMISSFTGEAKVELELACTY